MSYISPDTMNEENVSAETGNASKSRKYLIVFLWTGYLISFGWWLAQRVVIPLFYKKGGNIDWDQISPVFRDYSWPSDLLAVFTFCLICLVIKNKDARKFLIILTGILAIITIFGWIIGS